MKPVKKYKISRRLQTPLFEKCQTQKFVLREQRRTPKRRRGIISEYNKQLMEKQKIRYLYGVSEKVLKKYVNESTKNKKIDSGKSLVDKLERRLDNIVYRLGLTKTRRMARQLTSHGHFKINGRKITIPSYQVKDTDKISIREGSLNTDLYKKEIDINKISSNSPWVFWDTKEKVGYIKEAPDWEKGLINLSSVLEYYSR